MTKRNWLRTTMFLLMAGGFCSPSFAQGVYKSLCDTDPGCASGGCATGGCADAGCGCADGSCGAGMGLLGGCADGGCADAGGGCADLCEEESPWSFGGWMQSGYHTKNNGQFNSNPDELQLHQAYFYLQRAVDGSNGLDIGGRIDYVYGTDGPDTQAFGGNNWDNTWDNGADYGHAMPQLYGEVALGDLSVKMGHFYTLVGYETVTAPDNFFYSHAFSMYNSEPFTHTGVLATLPMGDVTTYGGWVQGWDTGFEDANGSQFIGGLSADVVEGLTATYITTAGRIGNFTDLEGYSHSLVFNAAMTDRLNVVLQTDMTDYNSPTNTAADFRSVGVNNYMLYSLTDKLGFGTRSEWWQVENAPGDNSDVLSYTVGLNVRPMKNLVVRPEMRYIKDNDGVILPDPADNQDVFFGIDTILTY